MDPIGLDGGINPYVYVGNNPGNWVDPWGLKYAEQYTAAGVITGGTIVAGASVVGDVFTFGFNILATPAEIGAGAALGGAIGFGIGTLLDMATGNSGDDSSPNITPGGTCPNGDDDPGDDDWVYGRHKKPNKWQNQMNKRGWTEDQVSEAIRNGQQFKADNLVNPSNPATRYVNPTTGRSVVIDNVTKELIHVGGNGFIY